MAWSKRRFVYNELSVWQIVELRRAGGAVGSWQDCTLLFSAFLSTSSYTTSHHYSLVCLLVHTLIHMFVWPHLCTKIHCLTTSNTNPQFKSTFSSPGPCSCQSWCHYHCPNPHHRTGHHLLPKPCWCHWPHIIWSFTSSLTSRCSRHRRHPCAKSARFCSLPWTFLCSYTCHHYTLIHNQRTNQPHLHSFPTLFAQILFLRFITFMICYFGWWRMFEQT